MEPSEQTVRRTQCQKQTAKRHIMDLDACSLVEAGVIENREKALLKLDD